VSRHSVISQGHYVGLQKPKETIASVMSGRDPKLLMDIHSISDVNSVEIASLPSAATSKNFTKKEDKN
jgi:NADH-quinone oxidoreductase subunit G